MYSKNKTNQTTQLYRMYIVSIISVKEENRKNCVTFGLIFQFLFFLVETESNL